MPAEVDTKIYNSEFFSRYSTYELWKPMGASIASSIYQIVKPKNLLDLGCGAGHIIHALLANHKIPVRGVEGSIKAKPYFPKKVKGLISIGNLTDRLDLPLHDTVSCLEVAEHIPTKYSHVLVDNCVSAAERIIIFSAAPTGQAGKGHINCQHWRFWKVMFKERGWVTNVKLSNKLSRSFKRAKVNPWYVENTRILERSESGT